MGMLAKPQISPHCVKNSMQALAVCIAEWIALLETALTSWPRSLAGSITSLVTTPRSLPRSLAGLSTLRANLDAFLHHMRPEVVVVPAHNKQRLKKSKRAVRHSWRWSPWKPLPKKLLRLLPRAHSLVWRLWAQL